MVLGIDIGTTSSKAIVVDENLNILGEARVPHVVDTPKPGFVEQKAEVWWADLCQLAKSLAEKIDIKKIQAVGLSSMGPNTVPISSRGEPLRPAILYGIDTRASVEIEELSKILRQDEIAHTHGSFSSQSILPKILWLKKNQSELFQSTHKVLTTNAYIGHRLTKNYALDYFTASAGALIDFSQNSLYEKSFRSIGVPTAIIPDLLWPGDVLGTVCPEAASATGLSAGTKVIIGTTDAANEAVVCGCREPGDSVISLGGTSIFVTCTDRPLMMENALVCNYLDENSYIIGGATSSGGILIDWFSKEICDSSPSELASLIPGQIPYATGLLALPYLNGARNPLNDKLAKGMVAGLTSNTRLKDVYMALIESLAMEIEMMIEDITKIVHIKKDLKVTGGGANNEVLLRTICEVLRENIDVLPPEMGAAAGAAVLAGAAIGEWTIDQAAKMVPVKRRYKYSETNGGYYDRKKELFRDAYIANKRIFAGLDEMARAIHSS